MATQQKEDLTIGLDFLGDVKLNVSMDSEQFTSQEGEGPRLGGGFGTVNGPMLKGTVRWDFYEVIGETFCTNTIVGYIDTEDGARINYVTRGHALVADSDRDPDSWSMTHSVMFNTEDNRYRWIDRRLGVWNGEFHMGAYKHNYKAYLSKYERSHR